MVLSWLAVLALLQVCAGLPETHYHNHFAVHVPAGRRQVDDIARRHGFINHGQIGSLKGYYLLSHHEVHKRSTEPSHQHHQNLNDEPEIGSLKGYYLLSHHEVHKRSTEPSHQHHHNLDDEPEIGSLKGYYLLSHHEVHKRSTEPSHQHHHNLDDEPEIGSLKGYYLLSHHEVHKRTTEPSHQYHPNLNDEPEIGSLKGYYLLSHHEVHKRTTEPSHQYHPNLNDEPEIGSLKGYYLLSHHEVHKRTTEPSHQYHPNLNDEPEIGSLKGYYLLSHHEVHKRTTEPSHQYHPNLNDKPEVKWFEQQREKRRVKLDYSPYESTLWSQLSRRLPSHRTRHRAITPSPFFPNLLFKEQWYLVKWFEQQREKGRVKRDYSPYESTLWSQLSRRLPSHRTRHRAITPSPFFPDPLFKEQWYLIRSLKGYYLLSHHEVHKRSTEPSHQHHQNLNDEPEP